MHKPLIAVAAVLASMVAAPSTLAQSPRHLYWPNFLSNTIGRANVDGTNVNESFITGTGGDLYGVAVPSSVTVSNIGQRDLSITGLCVTGDNPDDLLLTSDSCLANLAPVRAARSG